MLFSAEPWSVAPQVEGWGGVVGFVLSAKLAKLRWIPRKSWLFRASPCSILGT
jgi:hypothetical protein